MTRIDGLNELPGKLSIHVDVDHPPPHFQVRSPDSNAKIDRVTLEVIRGTISRRDYAETLRWVRRPENMTRLRTTWGELNERDG